jgi:hypothetical protein
MVLRRFWSGRRRDARRAVVTDGVQVVTPAVLGCVSANAATLLTLTTPQLAALWRKSAAGLSAATDAEATLEVVVARAAILAELERRDPVAMIAWVAAGATEPDGPSTYLLGVPSAR